MRLWQELEKLKSDGPYPFHMPGHKRNFPQIRGSEIDITEIEGFDNLHNPEGILLEEKERAARIFGSRETFLLVNGSSCGNLIAISAAVPFGGRVLMQKESHKSIYNGVRLRNAEIVYITSDKDLYTQIETGLSESKIDLVILTSPDYIGVCLDISAVSELCHKKGVPLLVDEAHGAHLRFCKNFPQDAVSARADFVVNSLHKTLPALTSTALLHVNGDLVDINSVRYYTQVFQTSSPSYVLMASISHCLQFLEEGEEAFDNYVNLLGSFYKETKKLGVVRVRYVDVKKCTNVDPGKILIYPPTGMTGIELANLLRKDYSIEIEMATKEYALAMTSVCDTEDGLRQLFNALSLIDVLSNPVETNESDNISASDAGENDENDIMKLVGEVAKVDLVPYPPGVPMVLAGEIITEETASAMKEILLAGGHIEGLR